VTAMNITCYDRDRILEDGSPAEWAALEAHASSCQECAEELRSWKTISIAAKEMRDYSDSPALWQNIERALTAQAREQSLRSARWAWLPSWNLAHLNWQTAAAGVFVLLVTASSAWLYHHENRDKGTPDAHFLKNRALADVERTESAYMQAIDKLAAEARPQLEKPATPLLSSYNEKLQVVDSAIDDLRTQAGLNPSNAHLRYQLLAMYQEKQRTLEEVLEMKR
jgi:hypothetical protein